MIIKPADDKSATINELESYLSDKRIPAELKAKIQKERNNISVGLANERDSAYLIDFRFGATPNWMVLHDLRFEEAGRVAQIDHLLINHFLDFYVMESKNFGSGISINGTGEFSTWMNGRPLGIASPIEQNRRHIAVLEGLLRVLPMPKRLGIRIPPTLHSRILVSSKATIKRPPKSQFNSDEVIKADALGGLIDREIDGMSAGAVLAGISKVVGQESILTIARLLAGEHRPIAFDYVGKFGLAPFLRESVAEIAARIAATPERILEPICPKCGSKMVMRKATKGANAGNQFWGCSSFPKCRGVVATIEKTSS